MTVAPTFCRIKELAPGTTEVPFRTRTSERDPEPSRAINFTPGFLSRFEIRGLVGSGSTGMVFHCFDAGRRRDVAVKVFAPSDDPALLQRFRQEGELWASLPHEHLVEVLDAGELGGFPFIVMELMSGGTLRDRLELHRQLPPAEAIAIATGVLQGLAACHQKGILHRDIKPENILFTADGRVKLADLGVAKDCGSADSGATLPGMIIGTPMYMAPEQARGEPATIASDLYAVGVVLYELIVGHPPFRAETMVELVQRQRQPPHMEEFQRRGVPSAVTRVITSALHSDAHFRPASAADFLTALHKPSPRATGRRHTSSLPHPRPAAPRSLADIEGVGAVLWMFALFGCIVLGLIFVAATLLTDRASIVHRALVAGALLGLTGTCMYAIYAQVRPIHRVPVVEPFVYVAGLIGIVLVLMLSVDYGPIHTLNAILPTSLLWGAFTAGMGICCWALTRDAGECRSVIVGTAVAALIPIWPATLVINATFDGSEARKDSAVVDQVVYHKPGRKGGGHYTVRLSGWLSDPNVSFRVSQEIGYRLTSKRPATVFVKRGLFGIEWVNDIRQN